MNKAIIALAFAIMAGPVPAMITTAGKSLPAVEFQKPKPPPKPKEPKKPPKPKEPKKPKPAKKPKAPPKPPWVK